MKISARIESSRGQHHVALTTNDQAHSIQIEPKSSGFGSSANGGELLFLALATCYCNDLYREAAKRGLNVERVEVAVDGEFGAEGDPARNVTYRAKVWSPAPAEAIRDTEYGAHGHRGCTCSDRSGQIIAHRQREAAAQPPDAADRFAAGLRPLLRGR